MSKRAMNKVMSPSHPKWGAFCHLLSQHVRKNGCQNDHTGARELLRQVGWPTKCAIDLNIELFQQFGGFCDCEILLNVEDSCDPDTVEGYNGSFQEHLQEFGKYQGRMESVTSQPK